MSDTRPPARARALGDGDVGAVLEQIRAANVRVFVACTGAGAGLQSELWSLPGSSSFFVGAAFPYAKEAIDDFLHFTPERYTAPEAALDLAAEAFIRAGARPDAVGIGLTATVASHTPHRGDHRIHAAWISETSAGTHDAILEKGSGAAVRARDGHVADRMGRNALLSAIGRSYDSSGLANLGVSSYAVEDRGSLARERFFARSHFRLDGTRGPAPPTLAAALPGTFDPPHEGHFGMADAFTAATGITPTFWITAEPPHKPPVPLSALLRRAHSLRGRSVLFTQGERLYLDKARAYPGCRFVVGADALVRLLDPSWGPSLEEMFREFRALGTHFYVASRVVDGVWLTLADIPNAPSDLCSPLPGRWDVSSTEIRQRG